MTRRVLIVVALAALCGGCVASDRADLSGNVVTRKMDLKDFDRVEVSSAIQADLRRGDQFEVEIDADESAQDYLDVRKSGDTLVLNLKAGGWSFRGPQVRATVTMPVLRSVQGSGASRIILDDFASNDRLKVHVSGASKIEGDLDAGDVDVEASGASHVSLKGRGERLDAHVSGASHIDLSEFRVQDADLSASGASSIRVYAKGELRAEASGASHITYAGDPKLRGVSQSGGATVSAAD